MSEVDWELRYQQSDTPWDRGQAHPSLVSCVQSHDISGAIVVPGCGRAWDLLALAECFPHSSLIGVDLSASAIRDAEIICRDHPRISLRQGDFFDLPCWHRGEEIGLVWEHTCFCAIPPRLRTAYTATVATLLAPGTWLMGAFFTDMDDENSGPPWNCPRPELLDWFSPHFDLITEHSQHATFPTRVGEERLVKFQRRF